MKKYVSTYKNLLLCNQHGNIEFIDGKYTAKDNQEIKIIENSGGFGKYIFEYKEPKIGEEDTVPFEEPEIKEFICEECGAAFTTRIALIGHSRTHKKG